MEKDVKRVWFVSHYSMPPQYEMRIKTQMYARYLQQLGIECTIFSASTIHNTEINLINDNSEYIIKDYDDIHFIHIKCMDYKSTGIKRIINMKQFAYKFYKIANGFTLPEVIVADVNCINYYYIYKFCKKNNITFIVDIRDLWPLSIEEYFGISNKNPIIRYLYHCERDMYKKADAIIFSMEGGIDYIKEKKWSDFDLNKIFYINNGVDFADFEKKAKHNIFFDKDLCDNTKFKIVYTGSIRLANNIKSVVDAAKLLKEYDDIRFLVYGDGGDRQKLESYCKEEGISNLIFKGQVEKNRVPFILTQCDLSILNCKKTALLKYGISPNKLFEYFAAGNPVLMTIKPEYDLVENGGCGYSLNNAEPEKIADTILNIYRMPIEEREKMGLKAKQIAKNYDYRLLTNKLLDIIKSTITKTH